MNELQNIRNDRNRKRLLAAAATRFIWTTIGLFLVLFNDLPLKNILFYTIAVHFTLNIAAFTSFYYDKYSEPATFIVITGDVFVISIGMAITGGMQSPFVLILPVVVALTRLLSTSAAAYYVAAFSSLCYITLGFSQQHQYLPVQLKVLDLPLFLFYLIFCASALFSLAILMAYVMGKMEQSELTIYKKGEELKESLEQVSALKNQQDGDYFLTSLLLEPLLVNDSSDDIIETKSILVQKKKFQFRKYEKDLGGDVNISHNIELNKRSYLLFLNADAMGKSMQGAGGAIVIGSVLQSIIERTHSSIDMQSLFPERWLVDTFTELQKVFEAFDGSMLISVVLGLIDKKTGLLYFINAEHPHIVLFRENKASFIIPETDYKKLGTVGYNSLIEIKTLQLRQEDIIICGSDGRDDLVIDVDESGNRIINDNENLFLQTVEEAKADLDQIYQLLENTGQLMDDLSLLSLSYKAKGLLQVQNTGENNELLKQLKAYRKNHQHTQAIQFIKDNLIPFKENDRLWKELIHNYILLKNFKKASYHLAGYLKHFPEDSEFCFLYSYYLRITGKNTMALKWGDRVFLRNANHKKNLLNLAKIHYALKNFGLAEKYCESLLSHNADSNEVKAVNKLKVKMSHHV